MNNNRSMFFALGVTAVLVCIIIAIVYFVGGSPLGHHIKHALLFLGLAVIAAFFAAVNRPVGRRA